MSVVVQRDSARFVTVGDGWVGRSCFSYGAHYDPANVSFGRMVACNAFVLEPGSGFGPHRHAGVDVVTTVLEGTLTHVEGSHREQRGPGSYVFATGSGVDHDERNDADEPVRFVQAWFLPGTTDPRPVVHERGPTTLGPGSFVLVVDGEADLGGTELGPGDSARVDEPAVLTGEATALVWAC
jgi:redox-sensitive bicupin YhaK (pirin superfamily)